MRPGFRVVHHSNGTQFFCSDILGGTIHTVIYNLHLERENEIEWINVHRQPQQSDASLGSGQPMGSYYYILKTDDPKQVLFTHRTSIRPATEDTSLFDAATWQQDRPGVVGFVRKDRLYLFDQVLACVYVIQGWQRPNLDDFSSTGNFMLSRANVPYESSSTVRLNLWTRNFKWLIWMSSAKITRKIDARLA